MGQDTLMSDRYLVVARLTQRQLDHFPTRGWVVVEAFGDEAMARDRFHQLRLPLERLKLGAVLIRAATTPGFERITYDKTIISKDADFWDLQHGELMRATEAQQETWTAAVETILADDAAQRAHAIRAAAEARASKARDRAGAQHRHAAMAAGFVAVLVVAGGVTLARRDAAGADPAGRTRETAMTVIIADPGDSRMLTEYALKPDGTRSVVRRLTREQVAAGVTQPDPEATASAPRPVTPKKNLAEALNGFFSVRE